MRHRRFTAAILALAATVLVSIPPAGGHPGATSFTVKVGVSGPIFVLVPADYGKPIDGVEITMAPGYRLDGATPAPGWKAAETAQSVTFSGGTIATNDAALFTMRGDATAKGQLIFPVTTHSPDGTTKRYAGVPPAADAGVVLYANTSPHRFPKALVGAAAIVVAALVVLVVIGRRRRGDRSGPDGQPAPPVPAPPAT